MADNNDETRRLLECFVEEGADFRMRPAPHRRQWMDDSPEGYAYRCLPLAIANTHGWEILNSTTFQAKWSGKNGKGDIEFATRDGAPPPLATSHFGEGVLTFHIPCLFKTPPGYELWVMGPPNKIKPYIQALNAVVETDWSPYTFTMNWKFSVPDKVVTFEENEPIATIFPIKRGEIETFKPVIRTPTDDAALWTEFSAWRASRNSFNKDLEVPGSTAQAQKWQKAYVTGPAEPVISPHRTKLRLRDFEARAPKNK